MRDDPGEPRTELPVVAPASNHITVNTTESHTIRFLFGPHRTGRHSFVL